MFSTAHILTKCASFHEAITMKRKTALGPSEIYGCYFGLRSICNESLDVGLIFCDDVHNRHAYKICIKLSLHNSYKMTMRNLEVIILLNLT